MTASTTIFFLTLKSPLLRLSPQALFTFAGLGLALTR